MKMHKPPENTAYTLQRLKSFIVAHEKILKDAGALYAIRKSENLLKGKLEMEFVEHEIEINPKSLGSFQSARDIVNQIMGGCRG